MLWNLKPVVCSGIYTSILTCIAVAQIQTDGSPKNNGFPVLLVFPVESDIASSQYNEISSKIFLL